MGTGVGFPAQPSRGKPVTIIQTHVTAFIRTKGGRKRGRNCLKINKFNNQNQNLNEGIQRLEEALLRKIPAFA
jgi:hypothetical protein